MLNNYIAKSSIMNRKKRQTPALMRVTIILLLLLTSLLAEVTPVTRVGIITPFTKGGDNDSLAAKAVSAIRKKYNSIEGLGSYTEKRMRRGVESFDKRYPQYCHEPRCAAALGQLLELDRMIFGDVIQNGNQYAVEFTLVDVTTQEIISTASLEGDPNVPLDKVISGAIDVLEDQPDSSISKDLSRYYGEEVDNKKAMYIATGSWIAFGSAFALIGNEQQKTKVEYSNSLTGIDPSMKATPKSARAKGLGNCYVAIAKDAYGAYYNPAGAAWVGNAQASVSYRNHFGMVNSMSAAFVGKATRELGWGHTFSYSGSPESFFQEIEFGTLISYKFNNLFGKMRPFSVGAKLNIASTRTTGSSGSVYDQKGTEYGFGLDIGMLFELTQRIDLGLVFNNIPYVIIHNNETQGLRSVENRPSAFKLGASYEVSYATLLIAEGTFPLYDDQLFRFAGGVEQKLGGVFVLRLGAEKETLQSYNAPWHLTTGLGFVIPAKERNIYLDGAYDFNTRSELLGIWDISLKIDI